mmetsp:Transcript_39496/g.105957  ORF Transcript_39496/g.105957 Transcript_39496/m.105957 type:complete len:208 (-) Transcript_39496:1097-1720(-)
MARDAKGGGEEPRGGEEARGGGERGRMEEREAGCASLGHPQHFHASTCTLLPAHHMVRRWTSDPDLSQPARLGEHDEGQNKRPNHFDNDRNHDEALHPEMHDSDAHALVRKWPPLQKQKLRQVEPGLHHPGEQRGEDAFGRDRAEHDEEQQAELHLVHLLIHLELLQLHLLQGAVEKLLGAFGAIRKRRVLSVEVGARRRRGLGGLP